MIPQTGQHLTTTVGEPVVDLWLERKIAQTANASTVQDRSSDPNLHRQVLHCLSYAPLPISWHGSLKTRITILPIDRVHDVHWFLASIISLRLVSGTCGLAQWGMIT